MRPTSPAALRRTLLCLGCLGFAPLAEAETITLPGGVLPDRVRSGERLVAMDGSSTERILAGNYAAPEEPAPKLSIEGGDHKLVGAINSFVRVTGGEVGKLDIIEYEDRDAFRGEIVGGHIGYLSVSLSHGSVVMGGSIDRVLVDTGGLDVVSGSIGEFGTLGANVRIGGASIESLELTGGATVVEGGAVESIYVDGGSLAIFGGNLNGEGGYRGAEVRVFGSSFSLDGSPIPGLKPGEPLEVEARGALFSATLLDGSFLEIELNDPAQPATDRRGLDSQSTLTIVLVPEPAALGGVAALLYASVWRGRQGGFARPR